MKRFKIGEPVIWQDEQTEDINGIVVESNKSGFKISWDCPSPNGDEKNEVFYPLEFFDLKTESGNPVIRLDVSEIRNKKINQVL